MITLLFLANSLVAMVMRKGSNMTAFIADSQFTYNDTFTKDDGLRFAFGIINYPRKNITNITDYL